MEARDFRGRGSFPTAAGGDVDPEDIWEDDAKHIDDDVRRGLSLAGNCNWPGFAEPEVGGVLARFIILSMLWLWLSLLFATGAASVAAAIIVAGAVGGPTGQDVDSALSIRPLGTGRVVGCPEEFGRADDMSLSTPSAERPAWGAAREAMANEFPVTVSSQAEAEAEGR